MEEVRIAGGLLLADKLLHEANKSSRVPESGAGNDKCGICSGLVLNRGVLDCCTHWFCFNCIDDWASVTNLCPLCKARFRFITCLPVGCPDNGIWDCTEHIASGLSKREQSSGDSSLPFSFPSYFIDEEAVVCLDGDACRVRAKLLAADEDTLATDTSVACDLCDCWYHAGCVNFIPEQSSFYCPRCITLQEKGVNPMKFGTPVSCDTTLSLAGSLHLQKELTYGGGMLTDSASVTIAVAEKGESAVSISTRRIVQKPIVHPDPVILPDTHGEMWSPIRETVSVSRTYGAIWSPIREPPRVAQDYKLWSPTRAADQFENHAGLWSPTPHQTMNAFPVSVCEDQPRIVSMVSDKTLSPATSSAENHGVHEGSTPDGCTGSGSGHHFRRCSGTTRDFDILGSNMDSPVAIATATKVVRTRNDLSSQSTTKDDILIDVDRLQVAVEQLRKGKRTALQEDERRNDSKDLPQPPHKVARMSTRKNDALDGRNSAIFEEASHEVPGVESGREEEIDDSNSKTMTNAVMSNGKPKILSIEEDSREQTDVHEGKAINKAGSPEVDPMDIVSDNRHHLVKEKGEKAGISKGVRTRIIMHRETDVKDTAGPSLVERIRQQMKDAAGYGAGEELSKVEVSDDRFIAAFKAALTHSHEKNKEAKITASRQRKPWWLAKVLNQKNGCKGPRDSLTRKLYAGGTGRWDRDWDIAFWKERSAQLRTARKEAEDEIEGKQRTRKHARGDDEKSNPEETDSIFSRLYLADTSLFPRNSDVKPLSVVKSSQLPTTGSCGRTAVKGSPSSLDKSSLCQGAANHLGKNQVVHSLLGSKQSSDNPSGLSNLPGSSTASTGRVAERSSGCPATVKECNGRGNDLMTASTSKPTRGSGTAKDFSLISSTKSELVRSQGSAAVKVPLRGLELTTMNVDVKKDKRQWALDVLARKTGNLGNASPSADAAGSATKKAQFGLLLQLPLEMRPLLPHNRHSKVPTAVRQVQLNRLVEQELRRANLTVIRDSPECEAAVSKAKSREEELYKKSNSKGVYINLCVRALAQPVTSDKVKHDSESDVSVMVQKALEATGLVASPPASPVHNQGIGSGVSTNNEAQESTMDHGPKSKFCSENKWVENVLEMGNLDIYGDFDFSLYNDLEDTSFLEKSCSPKREQAAIQEPENRLNRVTVILTTAKLIPSTTPEPAEVLAVTHSQSLELKAPDVDAVASALPASETETSLVQTEDDDDLYSGVEVRLNPLPNNNASVVTPHDNAAHSLAPSKIQQDMRETSQDLKVVSNGHQPTQAGSRSMEDWMNTAKFAELDRRIENIRRSTSPSVNGESDVPWKAKVRGNMEPTGLNDAPIPQNPVQKQVEIFVNQHLKPLYRSGVIKAEQFRYAVSKTAMKVMEHHANASSADFLITEGSKVKKLADQYLQTFSKRKAR